MKYKILPEKKLIIEVYIGVLQNEDYFIYKTEISNDKLYNPNYNILVDFRKAVFDGNISLIKEFIARIKDNPHMHGQHRSAYLTDTPNQVAITALYNTLNKGDIIESDTFTTIKAALKWVYIQESDFKLVEEELHKLI